MQVLYLHLAWPNYGLDVLNITMHIEVVIHSMNAYVWCWSKICGSLDEILSVTPCQLHPLTNVPTKYQLPTPYSFQDIARTRFYRSRSLQQGQRSNQGQTMTLYTYNP